MLLAACNNSPENQALKMRSSSGKTCEVLVAADKVHYEGATKALLDSLLREPQAGLPQPEPRFDIINVPVTSLYNTQMFKMHRNIIVCDVKAGNPDKFYVHHNQWAEPQVVVDVAASSDSSLRAMLRNRASLVLDEFYKAEYQRMEKAFVKDRNIELMQRVKAKYGFSIVVPQEFSWAKEDGDFLWLRKETKDFGLGVLVNVSPYRSESQFEAEKIANRLDTLMKREVPGPAEGSYMATERRVELESRQVAFGASKYGIETRGLWRLMGDFMGGPFVAYSLLSPDGATVVDLVGYVFCPRFDKRNYLMQVDGICRSIKWVEK